MFMGIFALRSFGALFTEMLDVYENEFGVFSGYSLMLQMSRYDSFRCPFWGARWRSIGWVLERLLSVRLYIKMLLRS